MDQPPELGELSILPAGGTYFNIAYVGQLTVYSLVSSMKFQSNPAAYKCIAQFYLVCASSEILERFAMQFRVGSSRAMLCVSFPFA